MSSGWLASGLSSLKLTLSAHHHPQTEVANVIDGVNSPSAVAVAWQSDELLPVMKQRG
jgi:hypothetical protein